MDAKLRGAKVIHIDPRFTRTSALADLHVPIRAGSDIALLGGLINYVLSEGKEFREYVVSYTNASSIISEDYVDTEDLGGVFSGWDEKSHTYDPVSWAYQDSESDGDDGGGERSAHGGEHQRETAGGDKYGSGGASVAEKP